MGKLAMTDSNQLREQMHAAGINMRYLGLLRQRFFVRGHHTEAERIKSLILTDMICRLW